MAALKPEPYSDVLHILAELRKSLQPISVIETHLFAYISCILGLWKGTPLAEWGYDFAVTSEGFPYSAEFEEARLAAISRGLITTDGDGRMTGDRLLLEEEIEGIFSSDRWVSRRLLAQDAVGCALSFPMGSIRFAVGQSPGVRVPAQLQQSSALFTHSAIDQIYEEYSVVRRAMERDTATMLAPAVVWLSARILGSSGNSNA